MTEEHQPLKLVYSYARVDAEHVRALHGHLALLRRQGLLDTWLDENIEPGSEWNRVIEDKLESADIILLLISSGFLESRFAYDIEMKIALRRHHEGTARVIPVFDPVRGF